jgi:hypothetical protein
MKYPALRAATAVVLFLGATAAYAQQKTVDDKGGSAPQRQHNDNERAAGPAAMRKGKVRMQSCLLTARWPMSPLSFSARPGLQKGVSPFHRSHPQNPARDPRDCR